MFYWLVLLARQSLIRVGGGLSIVMNELRVPDWREERRGEGEKGEEGREGGLTGAGRAPGPPGQCFPVQNCSPPGQPGRVSPQQSQHQSLNLSSPPVWAGAGGWGTLQFI